MKTINVTFEDKELEELNKLKGNKSWHDFILEMSKKNIVVEDFDLNMEDLL